MIFQYLWKLFVRILGSDYFNSIVLKKKYNMKIQQFIKNVSNKNLRNIFAKYIVYIPQKKPKQVQCYCDDEHTFTNSTFKF